MSDETNAASVADTQAKAEPAKTEPAKPELKSTDTGRLAALQDKTATAPQPKESTSKAKPDSNATAAENADHADSSSADHPDDERKLEPWMRKRIARAEERGRKLAKAELDEAKTLRPAPAASPPKAEPPAQPQQPAVKTLADFDYDVEKYSDYVAEQKVEKAFAKREAEKERQRKEQTAAEARTAFEKRKGEFEKRAGEGAWDDMLSAKVDVPQEVIDLLMGHDKDLDIAHYLINHTDELDTLRGKSKLAIARGLASIEAKLGGSTSEELPPKITKTPPPPPSVPGSGKSSKSIDDMSTNERIAFWKSQKAQRR